MTMEVDIPDYIDSQQQFLYWEVDELIPFVFIFMVGIIMKNLLLLLPIAIWISWAFSRYKAAHLEGTLHHMLYWGGLFSLNKVFKNGFKREYIQ